MHPNACKEGRTESPQQDAALQRHGRRHREDELVALQTYKTGQSLLKRVLGYWRTGVVCDTEVSGADVACAEQAAGIMRNVTFAAAMKASPMPVLPDVGSTSVVLPACDPKR